MSTPKAPYLELCERSTEKCEDLAVHFVYSRRSSYYIDITTVSEHPDQCPDRPGPSCSKLTMSLVNDSLTF